MAINSAPDYANKHNNANKIDLLSLRIQNLRREKTFNNFLDTQISYSKPAVQPLTEDITLNGVKKVYDINTGELKLTTIKNEDDSITTKEYCRVPYPYVQSSTTVYPDGKKIFVRYFPSLDETPAKKTEISKDGKIITITSYDIYGKEKSIVKTVKNLDGTGYEENTDPRFSRKNIKQFNKKGATSCLSSYVDGKLAFKLECDESGNLKHEYSYNALGKVVSTLQKEVIYNTDGSYTTKEYNVHGQIYATETIQPQREKNRFFR